MAVTAVSATSLCPCVKMYQPVCGSDGITYPNICTLKCKQTSDHNLTLGYEGECEELCFCPLDYNPVCGTNGETYPNNCAFKCAKSSNTGLELSHKGECSNENIRAKKSIESQLDCPCTKKLSQVCGTDGNTYGNACLLRCAAKIKPGLKIAHKNRCLFHIKNPILTSCTCPYIIQYVCGTDGATYDNPCILKCAADTNPGLGRAHRGRCENKTYFS